MRDRMRNILRATAAGLILSAAVPANGIEVDLADGPYRLRISSAPVDGGLIQYTLIASTTATNPINSLSLSATADALNQLIPVIDAQPQSTLFTDNNDLIPGAFPGRSAAEDTQFLFSSDDAVFVPESSGIARTYETTTTLAGVFIFPGSRAFYEHDLARLVLPVSAGGFVDVQLGAVDSGGHPVVASFSSALGSVQILAGNQTVDHLTVASGSVLSLQPGGQTILRTSSLALEPGARLDINNNALVVEATPETRDLVLTQLTAAIAAARGGALPWTGAGITSSYARGDASGITGLAVIINDDGHGIPMLPELDLDVNSVLVMYTYNGDADLNGRIDGDDYHAIDRGFLAGASPAYGHGDFNFDGVVDGGDYMWIDKAFLKQGAPLGRHGVGDSVAAVPDPGIVGLLMPAVLAASARRARRPRCWASSASAGSSTSARRACAGTCAWWWT